MPGLVTPNQQFGWIRADAADLDRKLRDGDGIHWSGDADLFLGQGVVEEVRWGRKTGKVVARRWEVWRRCEDGEERLLGHWRMEEFDRILFDLARMRAESPEHEDVLALIDKDNAKTEDRIWAPARDALGEMKEHGAKLLHDRQNPKNVFRQMPGRNPEKQQ
jgi:hypothetical protein